jgi:hypothetical protein
MPFGLSRHKLELLFLKIDCLEAYIRDFPEEAGKSAQKIAVLDNQDKKLLDDRELTAGMHTVFRILEGDQPALTSKDLEDLCRLEKWATANAERRATSVSRPWSTSAPQKFPRRPSSCERKTAQR